VTSGLMRVDCADIMVPIHRCHDRFSVKKIANSHDYVDDLNVETIHHMHPSDHYLTVNQ